eukprot:7785814-Heterocapsa_arctica.AAC.1
MAAASSASQLPPEWWKHGGVKIEFQQEHPKQKGSKSWVRFERYKTTTTVAAAVALGALPEDLKGDLTKKHMTIKSCIPQDPDGMD